MTPGRSAVCRVRTCSVPWSWLISASVAIAAPSANGWAKSTRVSGERLVRRQAKQPRGTAGREAREPCGNACCIRYLFDLLGSMRILLFELSLLFLSVELERGQTQLWRHSRSGESRPSPRINTVASRSSPAPIASWQAVERFNTSGHGPLNATGLPGGSLRSATARGPHATVAWNATGLPGGSLRSSLQRTASKPP